MSHYDPLIDSMAARLGRVLGHLQARVATAESCTGGGIAEAITRVAGSSAWFETGFVTYANHSKQRWLGVAADLLEAHGAVSEEVVQAMASGAAAAAEAQFAVAVSGVAGPDGGSAEKPVGTVWFGWALDDGSVLTERKRFLGGRREVRAQTVLHALERLVNEAEKRAANRLSV
ncbi:nicotinamide-nucleotide amidase [Halopseudomonas sabulinigri]|uniref:Nicotinamide-nucleotide amidase n=1 Tax=Halopseudomonas sabulinigri TaxID=472181 RepID=A0A1H1XC79_9GAMM|nr:nicotinamide-nucleotide amidohydrolase family protein [Halopseudomonas sabulinigri]SDT06661.1 nicotinamide-nucleotide amidase [Halopseudomonas sabulinigri]